jgi:hypothetical protein
VVGSVVALEFDATRAVLGVANSATFAAVNWPAGFDAPALSIPTLAATAPLAAVTMMAAAPATVSARCLFMSMTVDTRNPTTPSRRVKKRQSPADEDPKNCEKRF